MKRVLNLLVFVIALIGVATPGLSGTISKNNTAGNLNTTNVWVGDVVPGSGDIAQWDTNDTSQTSASLGGLMTWLGIQAASNLTAAYTTAEFADENIGDGKADSVSGITVTGTDAGNYTFNTTALTTANITAPVLTAPSITCPAAIVLTNLPGECSSNIAFTATATGEPTPTLLYTIDSTVITSPYSFPVGTTIVDSTASNDAGIATCSFTVTVVDNEPPTISLCATNVTVSCAADVPAPDIDSVTATDVCSAVTISFVDDTITNQICANRYTILRTYQAIDAASNTATGTQTITVDDQTAPVITASPADITVGCAASVPTPDDAGVTAADNCEGPVTVTHDADVISAQTCANRYTISRTYRATDACGNSSNVTQTITVKDQAAPILGGQGADETIESPATPVFTAPTASDNCDASPVITASDVTNHLCGATYSVTRSWTATDACGNISAPVSQTITVTDTTPPTITCPADVITGTDHGQTHASNVALGSSIISDNGTGNVTVANNASTQFPIGTNVVVWSATDACNNSASCTQLVIVADNERPTAACPANMLVKAVNPEGAVVTFAADVTDNGGHLTVTYNPASGSVFPIGTMPVSCTAADGAGNSNSCSFSVTVVDAVSFRILAITPQGNDVQLTWTMPQGCTGIVQAATGNLTNYTDIGEPIYVPGSGWITTNYLDVGGMTNTPARYYRIRLSP